MSDEEKEIEDLKKKHGIDKTVADALGKREAEVENGLDKYLIEIFIDIKRKLNPNPPSSP